MHQTQIDLKHEQQASLIRPRYPYSLAAKLFFAGMDVVAGKKVTLSKAKLLEMLASIPYREWERHQYGRLTRRYRNAEWARQAQQIVAWGRGAQDNEYWHLLVLEEKMKEEGVKDAWYLTPPIPWLMVWTYVMIARTMAFFSLRSAFMFNGQFEDHAEHEYARFVEEHPEWESQSVQSAVVAVQTDAATWADVFRRVGLDERDHRNRSFMFAGKPELVVSYAGMPD